VVRRLALPGSEVPLEPGGPESPPRVPYRRTIVALLLAVTAALALAPSAVGHEFPVAWLGLPVLFASLALGVGETALVFAWSLPMGALVEVASDSRPGPKVLRLLVLVLIGLFAILNASTRRTAQRRLGQVRAVARVAQSALLRPIPATVGRLRLAARYVSASAESRVGGDVLEVVRGTPTRWVVGDTRGKGLPAVQIAHVVTTSFRDACAQPGVSLAEVARTVDGSVRRSAEDEDFVTAVFAEFDPAGWLSLVNCGHPPPLRVAANGHLHALSPDVHTTPLGLDPRPVASTFTVEPGDRVVFFTDGLLEARDAHGRFFRLEDHRDVLALPDVDAVADALLARLRRHAVRRLDDDVALLVVEISA
jgi:hypothetical protein